jgi:hypothetical protein
LIDRGLASVAENGHYGIVALISFFSPSVTVISTASFPATVWTAADLVAQFGAIPLDRVCTSPPPGLATESDVIERHDRLPGFQLPLAKLLSTLDIY